MQALRLVGLGLLLVAIFVAALPHGIAYAQEAVQTIIDQTPAPGTPTMGPTPTIPPPPTPTPAPPRVHPGGPVLFTITGGLSLGTSQTQSVTGGGSIFTPSPSPSASPTFFPFQGNGTSTSQNTSESNAGMFAEASRRTATTLTDFKIPLGVGSQGSQIGEPTLLYSTPKYSLGYGPQTLDAFGQLALGSTLRGFTFIVPERYGQLLTYEGPAGGPGGEIDKVFGMLMLQARGSIFYEAGFNATPWSPQAGQTDTMVIGAATQRGNLGIVGEAAYQTRFGGQAGTTPPAPSTGPHGLAFQLQLNDSNPSGSGWQTTFRSVPDQFVAFGSGQINSDRYFDANFHLKALITDFNYERSGDAASGVNEARTETVGYAGQLPFGGYSVDVSRLDASGQGVSSWQNLGTMQLSVELGRYLTLFSSQLSNSDDGGQHSSTRGFTAQIQRAFGRFNVNLTGQSQRQTQDLSGPTIQTGFSTNGTETFGKTSVQAGYTLAHTVSPISNAIAKTPFVGISRQISPAIAIATGLGFQSLHDSINPSVDGHSRVFSLSLSAPFTLGNGIVTGRTDPRLPATIVGRIQTAANAGTNSSIGFVSFGGSSGGVGNVLVMMDNREIQRTDLTGGFEFPFVTPGQHQIKVDPASLPQGVTVSTPVQTITVQGGQTAQLLFSVGTFGGILGHVYGLDVNGRQMALPNVQLRVDNGTYAQTDATGLYGFGGLDPGDHVVTVVEESVPAYADFNAADLTQKVSVNNGRYTTVDFAAKPLGSISGTILFAKDMAPRDVGGVPNAYVVAEPGEHAAIDNDDGSFIIDNLPPGQYTISVDPETLDEGLGALPEDVPVNLGPEQHVEGMIFQVGHLEKKVVFSLLSGQAVTQPEIRLSERRLPPRGTTTVSVTAPASASHVDVTAFGTTNALHYDEGAKKWLGEIQVPKDTPAGDYPVAGTLTGAPKPQGVKLTVDPDMPLAILSIVPQNAVPGAYVTVRARFLLDVRRGDEIQWEDGATTVLGKPLSGRVFTFTLRLSLRPLHGTLLTRVGRLPIEIL